MHERAQVIERVSITKTPSAPAEKLRELWRPRWTLEKRDAAGVLTERIEEEGNLLLTAGVEELWKLFAGTGGTAFGATALLGVGDSSAVEAVGQTDLQASTNKLFKTVKAAPTISGAKITYQADFAAGEAEFKWKELALKNTGGILLNRRVNDEDSVNGWGDKSASPGSTWTLTLEIDLE